MVAMSVTGQHGSYLVEVDSHSLPHRFTDCLIIGGGLAGLRAAIEASSQCDVLLATKDQLTMSNTYYAQGGIAAVLSPPDSVESHAADTIRTARGIADEEVVNSVVREGPQLVTELLKWGAAFDEQDGKLALGREGGHSAARIIHANGDSTGKAVADCVLQKARSCDRLVTREHCFVVDLLRLDGICVGALVYESDRGCYLVWAHQTILASGGAGQLYRETTNPAIATADGHAMSLRAGAVLEDMEMMQFHPTTLYVAGAARALITEAVRGEGGLLLNRNHERFMPEYHEMAELAPRDEVSRAILDQMHLTNYTHIYLDVRHIGVEKFSARFPHIFKLCKSFDIDIGKDLIPVRPSAHYMIGGVQVDENGKSTLPGLWACGEAACTRLHGANRLASNSLLEALVYGVRSGREAARLATKARNSAGPRNIRYQVQPSDRTELDISDIRNSLQSLMARNVSITRNESRLKETAEIVDFWSRYVLDKQFNSPAGWELQNMLVVSRIMIQAALRRNESRGVHLRTDFPETDDQNWQRHLAWQRESGC